MSLRREEGQALIEFAFVAPLLVLALAGIVYCGTLVVTQEQLAVASRHVAREAAISATGDALKRSGAKGGPAKASARQQALGETALGRRGVTMKSVNWGAIKRLTHGAGTLKPLDGYTAVLYQSKRFRLKDGKSYNFGLGVMYHGVTVSRTMSDLSALGRMFGAMSPAVSATSVMPQELAPRGEKRTGILDMNDWITRIVNEPVK